MIHISLTMALRASVTGRAIVDGAELQQNTAMMIMMRSKKDSFVVLEGVSP